MPLFWFCLGLVIGLALWLRDQTRRSARLRSLLRKLSGDGDPSHLSTVAQLSSAITHQQQQLQGLEQQLRYYRQVLQAAPVGYLQVDDENQLLWCNDQAAQMLGIAPISRSQSPRLLLEWVRSFELDQLIEETRQSQTPQQQDWMLYRVSPDPLHPRDGPSYPLRSRSFPLEAGQVGVFLENRQEAMTLQQQRDRWISDVAHELKTPLTSIRLVAETLKPRIDQPLQGWIDRLLNETIRLSNLVEDLLNLSRLEGSDFQGLQLKQVDLPQLIGAAWQSLEPLAKIKHLQLSYRGPQELLIQLDETLMYRVLINLLDNAIKHSPAQASVYVELHPYLRPSGEDVESTAWVTLEVMDTGPGFKDRDLPHIFERFYRADQARTRGVASLSSQTNRSGGSGLGLAIVRQIIDTHQGRIQANNHPDTGGGWLKIELPKVLLCSLPDHE
ncbi:Sensor protein SphS [Halomicronema hongdechloris C2206]|uniref:histidine kinase n=1 Tax=Halomicronema hongdechloris C2206 TaxID=1641165 RepID=A0A1Z3HMK4_9CYAN|nr:ATP-binding protein [Halomicronema hongdechloris]ASC71533.1 Sensor protein SphS [Halomicronema hongdechloris C2206]